MDCCGDADALARFRGALQSPLWPRRAGAQRDIYARARMLLFFVHIVSCGGG